MPPRKRKAEMKAAYVRIKEVIKTDNSGDSASRRWKDESV